MPGPETKKLIAESVRHKNGNGNGDFSKKIALGLMTGISAIMVGVGAWFGAGGKLPSLASAGPDDAVSAEKARAIAKEEVREERYWNNREHEKLSDDIAEVEETAQQILKELRRSRRDRSE